MNTIDIERVVPMTHKQFQLWRFKRRIRRLLIPKKYRGFMFTHIDYIKDGHTIETVKL